MSIWDLEDQKGDTLPETNIFSPLKVGNVGIGSGFLLGFFRLIFHRRFVSERGMVLIISGERPGHVLNEICATLLKDTWKT